MTTTAQTAEQPLIRNIGPQREELPLCFGFNERKITKAGWLPLKLNRSGFHHGKCSSDPAATEANFGVDDWGWPYVSVPQGREYWTLNGEPLEEGRVYLDVDGRDVLVYRGELTKREFRFVRMIFSDGKGIFLACDWQLSRNRYHSGG